MLTRREALAIPALLAAQPAEPAPLTLQAGPLSLVFEPKLAFVRYLKFGDHEVLRGIYAAVRDQVWGTVAPRLTNLVTEITPDRFTITFDVACQEKEIDFAWKGRVTGNSTGQIQFTFDGEARSSFLRNRIGFCVLHPIAECAGKPCEIEEDGGKLTQGTFPLAIAPHQPFLNMKSIAHTLPGGAKVKVAFQGDLFEMEDHRNWTDGNYKTYCTPLARPWPHQVNKGDRVRQAITVTVTSTSTGPAPTIRKRDAVALTYRPEPAGQLPRLGTTHSLLPNRIRGPFAHLRLDLPLDQSSAWAERLTAAARHGTPLEVAVELGREPEAELALLANIKVPIARWLIYKTGEKSTKPQWIALARQHLKGAPIASGTNIYFTELNRERPPVHLIDQACYSLNPQVHAFDNTSLVENLEAQGDTLRTAKTFLGAKPIAVTPITLRPRFNAEAKVRVLNPPDPRQSTPFAAAWTLGSLKYMAENGAASVTYYEMSGPGGLAGASVIYPVGRLFEEILPWQGAAVHLADSSHPLKAIALVLVKNKRRAIFLANLTDTALVAHCPTTTADGLVPLLPYQTRKFETAI
jgi:D-apionolactonase